MNLPPQDIDGDPAVIDVLRAIADGTPIDWVSLQASPCPESFHEAINDLKVVSEIANLHRSLNEASPLTTPSVRDGARGVSLPSQPTTWGPLTLLEHVGGGAFGDVYRAWDGRLEREVALKILHRRDLAPATTDSRAVHEGRVLARVSHPNIVTVYGADVIDGHVGIWMEFVEGRTLEDELTANGPLPARELTSIGVALCRALAAVHDAGFVHRDIKAQNVLRDRSGRVVLGDFGTGLEVDEGDEAPRVAGTPVYLAPEVLNRTVATAQSDIYSLGVLLYHLATGSFPVRGHTVRELREAHARGNTAGLRDQRIDLPSSLVHAIERAIVCDPDQRFASAREFEAALTSQPVRRVVFPVAAIILVVAGVLEIGRLNKASSPAVVPLRAFFAGVHNETNNRSLDRIVADEMTGALSNAGMLAPISHEQVTTVLQSLNESPDAPLEGSLPFEIAARYGNVPVVVETETREARNGYRFTTTLWNAGDLRFSADSLIEDNVDPQRLDAAARKHSAAVIEALKTGHVKFTPTESAADLVKTRSTMALSVYDSSYRIFLQGRAADAIPPAMSAVQSDPDFASGWIWLAWMVRNAAMQADPEVSETDPAFRAKFSSYVEKAMSLAPSAPEWEQHWIRGSRATLYGDHAASIPEYEALLALRPNHRFGVNNLFNALLSAVPEMVDRSAAASLVATAKHLLPPSRWRTCCAWLDWSAVYDAWRVGDIDHVLKDVNQAIASHVNGHSTEPLSPAAGYFALALGRMHDAERLFEVSDHPSGAEGRKLDLLLLAELREDEAEMKRLVRGYPPGPLSVRPSRLIRAGLLDDARAALKMPIPSGNFGGARVALGHGQLLMIDNRVEEALPFLRAGKEGFAHATYRERYEACDAVARALKQLGRAQESLATLEECTAEPPFFTTALFSNATPWMMLKLDLARQYRAAGQSSAANEIERDIRRRLRYADPDFPPLARLNAGK